MSAFFPHKKRVLFLFLAIVVISYFPALASSDVVKKINSDGSLTLADGNRVRLAGIHFLPEFAPVLATLVSNKSLEAEYENSPSGAPQAAYFYVMTEEIHAPYKTAEQPLIQKTMLNELLLRLGAATVDESSEKYLNRFKLVQSEAKEKGYGLWSYEPAKGSKKRLDAKVSEGSPA